MEFSNSYEDAKCAEAYARLEFPGTYYLAFRDLPEILSRHVKGKRALDFGCGAGRSTRFLRRLGFETVGIDVSAEMIRLARSMDPEGDYRLIAGGGLGPLEGSEFDVALSAFAFDNIPTLDKKVSLFRGMSRLLGADGRIVNLVSSPEIYVHEWASFSTKDFPENRQARCGDRVKISNTDIEDRRPVEDIVWPDEDYRVVYDQAGLEVIEALKPLARPDEPYAWINETSIAPWVIYVLKKR
jgi:ubiquinone/menaquinone biosynthesis C-methylase UbiE